MIVFALIALTDPALARYGTASAGYTAQASSFMDYVDDDCLDHFTAGQASRIDAWIVELACDVDSCGDTTIGGCVATATDGVVTESLDLDLAFDPETGTAIYTCNPASGLLGWRTVLEDLMVAGARELALDDYGSYPTSVKAGWVWDAGSGSYVIEMARMNMQ